jgi:hypothetical protein
MAHKKISESALNEAAEAIKSGSTITAEAKKRGLTREGLSGALKKAKIHIEHAPKVSPKTKVVKQKRSEIKIEELPVVNQLEGELLIQRDENRLLKQQLKEAQVEGVTLKVLASQVDKLVRPIPPYNEMWRKSAKGPTKESCVLHLSDGHHDSVVHPHTVGGLETHDFNVAMARGEHMVDTILKFTQENMASHEFTTLWVLAYGDNTEGEIHGAVAHTHFGNMMRNCLAIGQFHAQMYRDLAAWFPEIKIIYLSGNHGRRKEVAKKDFHGAWDSWDYLIAETAKSYCKDLWNVEFTIPDSFSAVVDIEGYKFHVSHGDGIKAWNGIPFYGIERSTRRLTALGAANGENVSYYCMGHFHQHASQAALRGETFINGSWVATTPYSYNSFAGYNEPMQLLHGVHVDNGVTWRFPVKLKREEEVPKRYRVSLADPRGKNSDELLKG